MTQTRSWRSFVLARSLTLLPLAGCERVVRGDDPRLRYEGRVLRDDDGAVRMAWPRTTLHLRFRGTRLSLRVEERVFPGERPQPDALGVEVDGGPLRRVMLRPGAQELILAEGLQATEHRVRVMKLTEGEVGTVRVLDVRLREGALLLDAPPRPRRLLAVGDSISVGYGVDGGQPPCRASSVTCNAARAWPSVAADALGAELHVIAWSGRGLTRNYDPAPAETLPELMLRTLPTDPRARWEDARWPPTDIVVNVGTNDVARPGFDDARYAAALESVIACAQRHAPDARVRVLVGPMMFDDGPFPGALAGEGADGHRAGRRAQARGGFFDTAWVEVKAAPDEEGRGCEDHPSAITQRRIALRLMEALEYPRGGLPAARSPSPPPR